MPEPRRVYLNPSDYFFYAHHCMMQRRAEGGNVAFMMMDVDGHIESDVIRAALRRVLIAHPVLMSPLRISFLRGKPFWLIPQDRPAAALEAGRRAHVFEDLRDRTDWQQRLDGFCQERYLPTWDLAAGPPIRLEQYALPWNRSRFCLRWPHLLMDAAGAQWLLAELSRLCNPAPANPSGQDDPLPAELRPDHQPLDPLARQSWRRRWRLFLASFSAQRQHRQLKAKALVDRGAPPYEDQHYLHCCWDAGQVRQILDAARRCTPPGPARYARYLAACVLRALHRLYTEQAVDSEAYLITMPISVSEAGQAPGESPARPIPGNYLVSPTLWGRRDRVADKRAIGEDLARQLKRYHERDVPLMQWAMIWVAASSRAGFYQLLMRLPLGLEALASGFSYYGEISRPLRTLGGARISNLWGAGPLPTPPGWNPVFSRFDEKLNLSLTYTRPAISGDLARRYVRYIEQEVFESP